MKIRHEGESQKISDKLQKALEAELVISDQVLSEDKHKKLRELKNKQGAEMSARSQDMTADETWQVSVFVNILNDIQHKSLYVESGGGRII